MVRPLMVAPLMPAFSAIGPFLDAVLLIRDLDAAVDRYLVGLDWQETAARSTLPAARASALGLSDLAGRAMATVGSGVAGRPVVRLVEHPSAAPAAALRTHGWAALEFQVPDVQAATRRAQLAGFEVLNEPRPLQGGAQTLPLVAAQLAGPDGDAIYLTQINGELPNFDLPVPTERAELFICVYAAHDLERARAAVELGFQVRRASDREVAITVLNRQFGLPLDTLHRISSLQLAGRTAIEFDQYPAGAAVRTGADPPVCGVLAVRVAGAAEQMLPMPDGGLLEVTSATDCSSVTGSPVDLDAPSRG